MSNSKDADDELIAAYLLKAKARRLASPLSSGASAQSEFQAREDVAPYYGHGSRPDRVIVSSLGGKVTVLMGKAKRIRQGEKQRILGDSTVLIPEYRIARKLLKPSP